MRLLQGNLGRAIVKVSAVAPEHRTIRAPARVFDSQEAMLEAFRAGKLHGDFVAVIRGQGPSANGMPELHKLTPTLSVLQDRGQRVALLTDGRMSGASGTVLAAIHVVPEAAQGGQIGRLQDGDPIEIDAEGGELNVALDPAALSARIPAALELDAHQVGYGRELFALMRRSAGTAEQGGCTLFEDRT